jgi:hypothetical protein
MACRQDDDHQTDGESGQHAAAERGFHVAYIGNKPGPLPAESVSTV